MPVPGQSNVSQAARLMVAPPGFAVGWQEPVYLPDPAAGVNWSHKVSGRYYERVLAAQFTLATSAVVANRFPALNLIDGNGKVITSVAAGGTVVAGSSLFAYLTVDGPAYAFGNSGGTFGFMPDFLIPPDWSWQSGVSGIDAGDQLSNVVLLVQRFPSDTVEISATG